MRHPFEKLSPRAQRNAYWLSLAATLVIAWLLQFLAQDFAGGAPGEPLPYNIIDFELAKTADKSQAIIESWGADGRVAARNQILVDYAFLFAYPCAIAFGILLVLRNTTSAGLWGMGRILAWGQMAAGALDAVENAALITILQRGASAPLPQIAWWCAVPKFALVAAGILFLLAGVGWSYSRASDAD